MARGFLVTTEEQVFKTLLFRTMGGGEKNNLTLSLQSNSRKSHWCPETGKDESKHWGMELKFCREHLHMIQTAHCVQVKPNSRTRV